MQNSRRNFLKVAGVSALGVGVLGTPPFLDAVRAAGGGHGEAEKHVITIKPNPESRMATRWAMVIDSRKIKSASDMEPMIEACHKIHNVPHMPNKRHEIKWIWEEEYKHAFPGKVIDNFEQDIFHKSFLVLCNHCENPPCVQACPTEATFQREDGIVMMDFHRCIGCRFCMAACPFGARSFNFRDPKPFIPEINKKFPHRCMGVVEKCNFCAERLADGLMPACVEASKGALAFGDLDDPGSEVRKLIQENYTIRRKQNLGTMPSVYYIV